MQQPGQGKARKMRQGGIYIYIYNIMIYYIIIFLIDIYIYILPIRKGLFLVTFCGACIHINLSNIGIYKTHNS